jgi:sulfur-oxidizing protein SoxB
MSSWGPHHDAIPAGRRRQDPPGQLGSHGKFLSRLDLDLRGGQIAAYRHKLIPVLSREIPEDREMAALIRRVRAPHEQKLAEVLATSDSLLYRRGNFNGPSTS